MAEQPGDAAVEERRPPPDRANSETRNGALLEPEEPTAVEAVETTVEGVPSALSLAPSSIVPTLGGELVLSDEGAEGPQAVVSGDSVRSGLRQAGPLAIAGLVANGANVLVTIAMARLLRTRDYGALAQLTGLFLIVSMPGSAVIVGVVRRVTASKGHGSAVRGWRWARRLHVQGTVAVLVFLLVVILARTWLAQELSLPDAVGIVGVLGAGAIWVLLSLDRGLLQAHRNYRTLSINLLVEGGARTAAMLALVGAGFGLAGAAWGMFIGELVTAIHARVVADRCWSAEARREQLVAGHAVAWSGPGASGGDPALSSNGGAGADGPGSPDRPVDTEHRREMVLDLLAALAALALLALLQNVDVIVLGREAPHHSGGYAAISVTSKALVFGAIALGGYLLPEAAIRWRQGGHALRQLTVTFLLLAVPAVVLIGVAVIFPHLLLSVIFSKRYLGAEDALVWLVLAMVCLSVTVVLTMYLLAIGQRWFALVLAVGAVMATIAVVLAHGNPKTTAMADLAVQLVLAVVTIVTFAVVHKRRLRILA